LDRNAKGLSDAFSISRIGAEEVAELPLLNTARSLRETRSNIADEALALIGRQKPEEVAGVGVVVGIVAMPPSIEWRVTAGRISLAQRARLLGTKNH
jgi:hypothetical protein